MIHELQRREGRWRGGGGLVEDAVVLLVGIFISLITMSAKYKQMLQDSIERDQSSDQS